MTPSERAQFLIKEVGYDKAVLHAKWVQTTAVKSLTKEYWKEVQKLIHEAQNKAYDETLNRLCKICMEFIPEGTEYCSECKPK